MSEVVVNLIIQIVMGAIGGNAAGAAMKDSNLGALWNSVTGAIGGVGGGQLLQALMPAIEGASGGGMDIGAIASQVVGGGVAGAILTAIIGQIKGKMA